MDEHRIQTQYKSALSFIYSTVSCSSVFNLINTIHLAAAKNLILFHKSSSLSFFRSFCPFFFAMFPCSLYFLPGWLLHLSFSHFDGSGGVYVSVCVYIVMLCIHWFAFGFYQHFISYLDFVLGRIARILVRGLFLARCVCVASKTNRKTLPLFIEDENFLFFSRSPFVLIVGWTKENHGNIGKRIAHTHTLGGGRRVQSQRVSFINVEHW